MADIVIPRASGLVVMTAAKQECIADGPRFESGLVHVSVSNGRNLVSPAVGNSFYLACG